MTKIIFIFSLITTNLFAFEINREQCTIDMAKYLSFYNYKGMIPTIARPHVKRALTECSVPFGDDATKRTTKCAYEKMRLYAQLGGPYDTCNEINSAMELNCLKMIYSKYEKSRMRPTRVIQKCAGVVDQESFDCIDKKTTGLKKYLFDEEDMQDCKELRSCDDDTQYYLK